LVNVIDPIGVEQRCPTLDPVYHIALIEQKLGEVRTILPGDTRDERCLQRGVAPMRGSWSGGEPLRHVIARQPNAQPQHLNTSGANRGPLVFRVRGEYRR